MNKIKQKKKSTAVFYHQQQRNFILGKLVFCPWLFMSGWVMVCSWWDSGVLGQKGHMDIKPLGLSCVTRRNLANSWAGMNCTGALGGRAGHAVLSTPSPRAGNRAGHHLCAPLPARPGAGLFALSPFSLLHLYILWNCGNFGRLRVFFPCLCSFLFSPGNFSISSSLPYAF